MSDEQHNKSNLLVEEENQRSAKAAQKNHDNIMSTIGAQDSYKEVVQFGTVKIWQTLFSFLNVFHRASQRKKNEKLNKKEE